MFTNLKRHIDGHEEISSDAESGTFKSAIPCLSLGVVPHDDRVSHSYHGNERLVLPNVQFFPAYLIQYWSQKRTLGMTIKLYSSLVLEILHNFMRRNS